MYIYIYTHTYKHNDNFSHTYLSDYSFFLFYLEYL